MLFILLGHLSVSCFLQDINREYERCFHVTLAAEEVK